VNLNGTGRRRRARARGAHPSIRSTNTIDRPHGKRSERPPVRPPRPWRGLAAAAAPAAPSRLARPTITIPIGYIYMYRTPHRQPLDSRLSLDSGSTRRDDSGSEPRHSSLAGLPNGAAAHTPHATRRETALSTVCAVYSPNTHQTKVKQTLSSIRGGACAPRAQVGDAHAVRVTVRVRERDSL
jgi:hypothetical protein